MPSVLIGPVLMAAAGLVLLLAFFAWMTWELGWLAEKRHALSVPRRSALEPPPVVTVLDGVVIPKRKEIEP